jgi:hypothetical protein
VCVALAAVFASQPETTPHDTSRYACTVQAKRINGARDSIKSLTEDVQRMRLAARAQRIASREGKHGSGSGSAGSGGADDDVDVDGGGDDDEDEDDDEQAVAASPEELQVLQQIASAKREYKEGLAVLKKVKKEVGVIQEMIKSNTEAIKSQFQTWFERLKALLDGGGGGGSSSSNNNNNNASSGGNSSGNSSGGGGTVRSRPHTEDGGGGGPGSGGGDGNGDGTRGLSAPALRRPEGKHADVDADALFKAARDELLARKSGK